jgi:hypothetical protein
MKEILSFRRVLIENEVHLRWILFNPCFHVKERKAFEKLEDEREFEN